MDVIIVIVSLIGWKVSGYDFPTLHFYISLAITLYKAYRTILKIKLPFGR